MAERTERESPRNKALVTPEPTDPAMFAFIERLFEGKDEMPERIELRQAFGPGMRKLGNKLIQKEFKPGSAKPDRAMMVGMSNEFLTLAQNDCNAVGKKHGYQVCAQHFRKSDSYYAQYPFNRYPTQRPAEEYDPNDPNDEDPLTPDGKHRDSLLQQMREHTRESDEHERFRQDQHARSTEGVIGNYQTLVQQLMNQTVELSKIVSEQMREGRELFRVAEEALSKKVEREIVIKREEFKMQAISDALQFVKAMAPVVVNQLGKNNGAQSALPAAEGAEPALPQPPQPTPESMGLKTFIDGLSEMQAAQLFGKYQEDGTLDGSGVFGIEQTGIVGAVAHCKIPADALDSLSEGPYAITGEQFTKLQTIVSSSQFGPLAMLFMQRQQKKAGN